MASFQSTPRPVFRLALHQKSAKEGSSCHLVKKGEPQNQPDTKMASHTTAYQSGAGDAPPVAGSGSGTIDTDLYSRQIGAFGLETMGKLIKLRVLICGLRGVGAECGKE